MSSDAQSWAEAGVYNCSHSRQDYIAQSEVLLADIRKQIRYMHAPDVPASGRCSVTICDLCLLCVRQRKRENALSCKLLGFCTAAPVRDCERLDGGGLPAAAAVLW